MDILVYELVLFCSAPDARVIMHFRHNDGQNTKHDETVTCDTPTYVL